MMQRFRCTAAAGLLLAPLLWPLLRFDRGDPAIDPAARPGATGLASRAQSAVLAALGRAATTRKGSASSLPQPLPPDPPKAIAPARSLLR